jgi:hypothetical protein
LAAQLDLIGGKENNPKGELGILKQLKLSGVEPFLNRCFLWEYEGSIYLGCLLFDNKFFCERISTLLGEHSGSSIRGITVLRSNDVAAAGGAAVSSGVSLQQENT